MAASWRSRARIESHSPRSAAAGRTGPGTAGRTKAPSTGKLSKRPEAFTGYFATGGFAPMPDMPASPTSLHYGCEKCEYFSANGAVQITACLTDGGHPKHTAMHNSAQFRTTRVQPSALGILSLGQASAPPAK